MLIKAIPLLENGFILKRNMLTAIADAAFLTSEYLYKGFSDGILSGCGLDVSEGMITVREGAVLSDGQIFLIREALKIPYVPSNKTVVLKLCFSNELRDADCVYREMDVVLTERTEIQKGELELCRFKLQEGAVLRSRYRDFEDRDTEYDTLNTIYAPYAAAVRETLSPDITRSFAREMMKNGTISDFDALFCLQLLSQRRPVEKEALQMYISHRKKAEPEDMSNIAVYRELVKILRQERGAVKPDIVQKKKRWKITMD